MQIRKAKNSDASRIAAVHLKSWQTTYKNILPDNFLSTLSINKYKTHWKEYLNSNKDKTFTYVALNDDGDIVGFSFGGLEQQEPIEKRFREEIYTGELRAIYILGNYQRKGIGSRLVFRVITHLRKHKIFGMLTWVLKDNPSTEFYKSLYGKKISEGLIEIGGIEYIKYAYGWEDLSKISRKIEKKL